MTSASLSPWPHRSPGGARNRDIPLIAAADDGAAARPCAPARGAMAYAPLRAVRVFLPLYIPRRGDKSPGERLMPQGLGNT
jgi:hypothetical protein